MSLQIKALLAMPTALRPVLLGACAQQRLRLVQPRSFSASSLKNAAVKYPNVAAFSIPEFRTSSIAEISPDDLFKTSSLASAPDQSLEEGLSTLYTHHPAAFVYAESDFYKLKKNTWVPEVCVLGRSNVGKSSFVNALAQRANNALAFVSSKAGKTRSINTYGFGPAPTIKDLQARGPERKDEDIPTHTFYLVDMPGYGHASLKEWGKNISLYLNKRNAVKGAIVLIDAEVGPKDSDAHLLQLLNAAQLKTAIVLTKADKVKQGVHGLRDTCRKVWDVIHATEAGATDGNWAWEKDVYVTAVGAKDSDLVKSTVTTARLAAARLAGLVKDDRPSSERNKRWSGKTISFDDLQYATNESHAPVANGAMVGSTPPLLSIPSLPKRIPTPFRAGPASSRHKQAIKAPRSDRLQNTADFWARGSITSGRATARAFHTISPHRGNNNNSQPKLAGWKAHIDDFMGSLRADKPRDEVRRWHQQRERWPPKLFKASPETLRERQAQKLEEKFPEVSYRSRELHAQRAFDYPVASSSSPHTGTGNESWMDRRSNRDSSGFEEAFTKSVRTGKMRGRMVRGGNNGMADRAMMNGTHDPNKPLDPNEFQQVFAISAGLDNVRGKTAAKGKKNQGQKKQNGNNGTASKAMASKAHDPNKPLDASEFEQFFASSAGLDSVKKGRKKS
ncbi:putative GTP-binding protein [Rosellinia necatrix]|uniref:Putative GTP-binding protein n=1 Tax=Rosellinia necatrix TaxID=77044 RepID=A0A1W2TWA0_ROSNE|nr:putative GTP-binding protein [Rosellinia necatrix]